MQVFFKKKFLSDLYKTGQDEKKHGYPPQIIKKYIRTVDIMISVPNTQSLLQFNALHYEKLVGDKAGLSSVRVNDQYRIEFEETRDGEETTASIVNITDLSNHYS